MLPDRSRFFSFQGGRTLAVSILQTIEGEYHMQKMKEYRNMKVYEQSGCRYEATPTIMLKGQWLKDLGFDIGDPVLVKCENGKLIITSDTARAGLIEAEKAFMEEETKKLHQKFLAVDFNPQSNLTTCFGAENVDVAIGNLMMAVIEEEELPERDEYIWERNGMDFIPLSIGLSAVEAKLNYSRRKKGGRCNVRYISRFNPDRHTRCCPCESDLSDSQGKKEIAATTAR